MQSFLARLRSYFGIRMRIAQREVRNRFFVPTESFVEDVAAAHGSIDHFFAARRAAPRQYVELMIGREEALARLCPELAANLLTEADRAVAHTFDLLGSGPFVPVDHDRGVRPSGYRPIDWYLDPVRNLRFPVKVPYKEWKLYEMRPQNADVKYPWELARSQHFATLAEAWRMSKDARYARELFDQIADFMEANPVGFGINWTCTMDVAIRAGNWALALALTLDCAEVPEEERAEAYAALFDHGKFIFENLENTYEVTSNHFLSNVIGLHFLAAEFADLPQGRLWDEFCRTALEREMTVQIHPEGADFESAVPYHRLVTELFLASCRLAQMQQRPLSDAFQARLAKMVEFLLGVQRPDGLMPVIGDADDGRFHIFTRQGSWVRQDARHIYAPASMTLGREDFLAAAPPDGVWEAAWWGFEPQSVQAGARPAPDACVLYPDVGIAVARRGGHYLAVTNGAVGTKGFGNHKHNELLGFEYHAFGDALLVDAGSHVYTSDFASRNVFRSTAIHNTVMIEGVEQNETNPEWIFRLFESANPEHVLFEEQGDVVRYVGRHTGYQRIPAKAMHERRFDFDRNSGRLVIEDVITAGAECELRWHLHAAPGVRLETGGGRITAVSERVSLVIDLPEGFEATVTDTAYSPSYGVVVPCQAADIVRRFRPDGAPIRFTLTPAAR